MVAQVADRHTRRQSALAELGGHARQKNLTAVGGGADTGGPMYIQPDIRTADDCRLASVQAHPHRDRHAAWPAVSGQRALRIGGCGKGGWGHRKDDEERVALCVDFESVAAQKCVPQPPLVLLEDVGIGSTEALQEARRTLYVREQKRERASRQVDRQRMPPARLSG